jgi:hypothetical protein
MEKVEMFGWIVGVIVVGTSIAISWCLLLMEASNSIALIFKYNNFHTVSNNYYNNNNFIDSHKEQRIFSIPLISDVPLILLNIFIHEVPLLLFQIPVLLFDLSQKCGVVGTFAVDLAVQY